MQQGPAHQPLHLQSDPSLCWPIEASLDPWPAKKETFMTHIRQNRYKGLFLSSFVRELKRHIFLLCANVSKVMRKPVFELFDFKNQDSDRSGHLFRMIKGIIVKFLHNSGSKVASS